MVGEWFTEWINVAKVTPLIRGHCQPPSPADLGFDDLRIPEVREALVAGLPACECRLIWVD
jgi:hypothetical protein